MNPTYPKGSVALVVETALGEVGVIETGNNLTKYGEFTGFNGAPWCGSFVNYVLNEAGVKVHLLVSTAIGAQRFKNLGRWKQLPQVGDLAFMDFPHDGVDKISHIGIVCGINPDGKTVVTIEGNTSPSGNQRNGGMVMIKLRNYGAGKEIQGFGRPRYISYSGPMPFVVLPGLAKKEDI